MCGLLRGCRGKAEPCCAASGERLDCMHDKLFGVLDLLLNGKVFSIYPRRLSTHMSLLLDGVSHRVKRRLPTPQVAVDDAVPGCELFHESEDLRVIEVGEAPTDFLGHFKHSYLRRYALASLAQVDTVIVSCMMLWRECPVQPTCVACDAPSLLPCDDLEVTPCRISACNKCVILLRRCAIQNTL